MTREMNKPEWHYKWVSIKLPHEGATAILVKEERILNPDIAEFFYATKERLK